MLKTIGLTFSILFASNVLVACGDNARSASPAQASAFEGMSEKEAVAKLGEPTLTQSYSIDELTVTHSEWTTAKGTTSIQFQNGEAKFSLFIPGITQ